MMFTRWHANAHLHLICACFGPPESTCQTASQSVQPLFAHLMAECPYTLQWTAPFFFKIAPSHGGSGPPSNTWFLEPTQVHNTNGILISSAVFSGLTIVTDRQTDHATLSVTTGRIQLMLQCGLIMVAKVANGWIQYSVTSLIEEEMENYISTSIDEH